MSLAWMASSATADKRPVQDVKNRTLKIEGCGTRAINKP
jgi:hypothetical protein